MTQSGAKTPFVAIACGGTGGHLFPGLAVAAELRNRGCRTALLISPKEIDRQAVKATPDVDVFTLPAVGLQNRNYLSFAGCFAKSLFASRGIFRRSPPDAVLAMGGFTSAPPVLVGRNFGAQTFLHESNTIPGRANRFLARFVNEAFVGFPETASRLKTGKITATGTPVRSEFDFGRLPVENCRAAVGLDPRRATVLVMGGSQGAAGINEMILAILARFGDRVSAWQWLHLTGKDYYDQVKAAYNSHGIKAVVKPFLAEMDLALAAATVSISRAGASSLAEIAAMRLPSVLVPFPAAADDHQFHNARAFEKTGAARLVDQKDASPEKVVAILRELAEDQNSRAVMKAALEQWHKPRAAEHIAAAILQAIAERQYSKSQVPDSKEIPGSDGHSISRFAGIGMWMLTIFWSLEPGVRSLFAA